MSGIKIGRLLRSGTTGFVVGCKVNQLDAPSFGAMTRVSLGENYQVYGLIYDIHIDDDGLVRQLITAQDVPEEYMRDTRENRNVPVEIGVLALGYEQDGVISHLLPPRPPLSLDEIFLCTPNEIAAFTGAGRMGYLRHILRDQNKPVAELLAAHLRNAREVQEAAGHPEWFNAAVEELITLMKDDYPTLMTVLGVVDELETPQSRQVGVNGRIG
ncbi:MAG: hypothetical protein H0S82_00810 [Anaerolineaceae bacterium]|nr:hypothetical protein [Anaerolineaceae bacterium]